MTPPVELLAGIKLVAFDFDGVFTDNTVYVSQDGTETVRCWRSDGLGLSRLRGLGVHMCILSTEMNPVVAERAKKLRIPCRQGLDDKAAAVVQACREYNVDPRETMFVGNDINDIPAFGCVGFPVAVANAHPETFPHVQYRTQKPGGFGAVREICDMIFFARQSHHLPGSPSAN